MENILKRNIDFILLCNECKTDRSFSLPIGIPKEMYLGINQFKEILSQKNIECYVCGQSGFAGDEQKFKLIKTKGLDDDLSPNLSNHEKRQWFNDLHLIFQIYLKKIFNINEFAIPGFALDFYQCRLLLIKKIEKEHKDKRFGVYLTDAVLLENGINHTVKSKFPFIYEVGIECNLPEELIINPKEYNADEEKISTGDYIPVLVKKVKT
jgi:hypothetical protein